MKGALDHITVVLVRPQQAGNIGVAARAIANLGVGRLALVAPPNFDPERARWMAPKSHHVINDAHYCESVADAVAHAQRVIATTARPRSREWPVHGPLEVSRLVASDPVPTAILFGPEDSGLSNEDLGLAEALLHFPTGKVSSINLGQAVTATVTALASAHQPGDETLESDADERAPVGRREDLVKRVMEVLDTTEYLQGRSDPVVSNTLIRLAARADLRQEELNNLLGMVKQVRWWLKARSR